MTLLVKIGEQLQSLLSLLIFPIWAPFGLIFLPILIRLRSQPGRRARVKFAGVLLAALIVTLALPIWLVLALYCLPSIAAVRRGVAKRPLLIACNVLLGWTLIFWGITLIWALLARGEAELRRDYKSRFYQPVGAIEISDGR